MLHQAVFNTSEICNWHGVRHAILSPGSRNAPLIVSFARNKKIKKHIIPDERAAGFIALGIAQKLKEPVVLCCTSGTALLNYAPAIAEAFYREIPLIVLSADRPPELIDQRDGQTIRQFDVLKNHVKLSTQLPIVKNDIDNAAYESELVLALEQALQLPNGPVHVNIPFREPFYPTESQNLSFDYQQSANKQDSVISRTNLPSPDFADKKVLILVGQQSKDPTLNSALSKLSLKVPVIQAPLNNLEVRGIEHVDLFLESQTELAPDILLTSGLSVLSKKLKMYIKEHTPDQHYHFDPSGVGVDTYGSNPVLITDTLESFLDTQTFESVDKAYLKCWRKESDQAKSAIPKSIAQVSFSECQAFHQVSTSLPAGADLHLSNSMPVRFADIFGIQDGIQSWCNRGTSGIDGCTSTALGTSIVSSNLNILLTGDVSFLYDRNAFFHNYKAPDFRIVIFNNQGGGIFRLIEGPKKLPELEAYFETRHDRTAKYICQENEIEYMQATSEDEVASALNSFYEPTGKTKLLEIFTVPETNEQAFKQFKHHINEQLNF